MRPALAVNAKKMQKYIAQTVVNVQVVLAELLKEIHNHNAVLATVIHIIVRGSVL
jgi:hypothetical protein